MVLWAVPLEVPMLLTGSAFEGEVFIVYFLVVGPGANRYLHSLREPCLQVNFNTYSSTVVYGLIVYFINEFPYSVPYLLKSFIIPAMDRQIGKTDPYRHLLRKFHRGVEIRGLAVQVQPLGTHKIWPIF